MHRRWLLPTAAALAVIAVAFGVIIYAGGHSTSPAPAAAASLTPRSPAPPAANGQPTVGPVYASPPSAVTTGALRCVVPAYGIGNQPKISRTAPPVSIDANPTGVTVVWWDGMNQPKPCRTRITHGDAARARRLAADIRSARRSTYSALTNCPADDGTGLQLFFTYTRVPSEMVSIKLNGCRTVMALSRAPRAVPASLLHALAPLRPSS